MGRRRLPMGGFSLLAAVVALVSQLAVGSMLLLDDADAQNAANIGVMCDGTGAPGAPAQDKHRPATLAICPISVTLALPAVVPTPAANLPVPSVLVPSVRTRLRPPGRGPPAASARVGEPRGPPVSA